jgi:hypothetical protein
MYFGLGQLVAVLGDEPTLIAIRTLYPFTDEECLRFNQLCATGMLCVLIGAAITPWTFGVPRSGARSVTLRADQLGWLFLIVGGFARYGLVIPFALGLQEGILPGIVSNLSKTYAAGLMLQTIHGLQRRNWLLIAVTMMLACVDIGAGMLLFNKTEVMLTILFMSLALYTQRPKPMVLAGIVAVAVFTFMQIVPIVSYGRDALGRQGSAYAGTLEQRTTIMQEYFRAGALVSAGSDNPSGLLRLSYTNAGTLIMSYYDAGAPRDTIANVAAAVVPRILWPDKPNLSAQGTELYFIATGQVGSSISATLFGEAYGNYGWLGVPFLMIPYGVILALLSRCLPAAMVRGDWFLLPAVLMGIVPGLRVDGSYAMDVVGGPLTTAVLIAILTTATRMRRR